MMKTRNISTDIIQSAETHSAKLKTLCLLFLPTENKRQILRPLSQLLHPPRCLLRFSSLWMRPQRRKCRKTSLKNESLGLVKKWRGFCWGKHFSGKLNDAISNLRKTSVSCAMLITHSFIYFEVLAFWAGQSMHHSFSLSWSRAEVPGDGSDCGASWTAWSR